MPSVFVIGGARRLGAAIAKAAAERGFDVGITWNSDERQAEASLRSIQHRTVNGAMAKADVAQPKQLTDALESLTHDLGIPHAIILNAGVFPPTQDIATINEEDVLNTIRVNTLPIVTVSKWYYPHCHRFDAVGRIVSIGSLGAEQIWKNRLAYNVSKAALSTAIQSLARSCAPHIAINSVAPGMIVIPDEPSPNDTAASPAASIPMKRYGTTNDVVDAVMFFIQATAYISGETIRVDGGHHLL